MSRQKWHGFEPYKMITTYEERAGELEATLILGGSLLLTGGRY